MIRRLLSPVLLLLLTTPSISFAATNPVQDTQEATARVQAQLRAANDRNIVADRVLRMYRVPDQHNAADVLNVLSQLIIVQRGEAMSTLRNNPSILFVAALPETHKQIEAFLEQLSAVAHAATEERQHSVRVFPLKHKGTAPAMNQLVSALSGVLDSSGVAIARDDRSNALIMRGMPADLDQAEAIISALDVPVESTHRAVEDQELTVRICWLVSGVDDLAPVPADMKSVTDELARAGVTGLRLAAQSMTRVTRGRDFASRFQATVDGPWHVQLQGRSGMWRDLHALTLTIEGNGPRTETSPPDPRRAPAPSNVVSINTSITTVADHFVVLGMTPIGSMDSVFVVQIIAHE